MGSDYEVLKKYEESQHGSVEMVADDAVYTLMATGQQWRGKDEIMGMLNYFYRVAFTAHAVTKKMFAGEGYGCIEAEFTGTHTGEFAGMPATGKTVNVPLAVIYEIGGGKITAGHIYFEMPALMAQLEMPQSSQAAAD